MMLVDYDEVSHLGIPKSVFHRKWVPDEPEAIACDYADVIADGPFILVVNDETAWLSHGNDDWMLVARNPLHAEPDGGRWSALANLYADSGGISVRSLTFRIRGMRKQLLKNRGDWFPWDEVYRWDDGSDLVWSSLMHHDWLKIREHEGVREVQYVAR